MTLHAQHSTRIEQPGAAIIEPIKQYWERFGRITLGALAAVAVIGIVVLVTMRSRRVAEEAAAGRLAEASLFYWQGDYTHSLQVARETAQQYPTTPSGIDALRQSADAAYWGGDFAGAVTDYRRYLAKQPNGLLADAARRSLAYALESSRQFVEASHEYETLVGRFDRASSAEFLLGAARCLKAAGQTQEAVVRLQRAVDEFGETEYADRARIELAEMRAAGTLPAR